MNDATWKGKTGSYRIDLIDENGQVRAQASGPLPTRGVESIGVVATKFAKAKDEAKRLLLDELKRRDL